MRPHGVGAHALVVRGIGIPACAVLLACLAGAQPRPFSHRLHLELKLACTQCHTGVEHSTRVDDDNLPAASACKPCHQDVPIPAAPKTLVAHFSHEKHLKLGNVAPIIARAIDRGQYLSRFNEIRKHLNTTNPCLACHRGIEASEAVSHANMPQMADCLVCHNKIDLPFSCEYCHATNEKLRPADHPRDFLESHTRPDAKFDKASCAVCHGRTFRCMGCH